MKGYSPGFDYGIFSAGKKVLCGEEFYRLAGLAGGPREALAVPAEGEVRFLSLAPSVKKIYLELTTRCNFSCITCVRHTWDEKPQDMEEKTIEAVLKGIEGLPDLEWVHIGGFGEPFCHPACLDVIAKLKERGLKVELITNGSLLTEECVENIVGLGLDRLFVSIDAPQPEEYARIRVEGDFSAVVRNIEQLNRVKRKYRTAKPVLGLETVIMKRNFRHIPELIRLAWRLNALQVILTNLLPYHESMRDEVLYDMDDTGNILGSEDTIFMVLAQVPNMKLRTERYCKFIGDGALCINCRGYVSPCYALMHRHSCYVYERKKEVYPFYLGNVKESGIGDIWTSVAYVNFRWAVKYYRFPSCTDCRYKEGCNLPDSNEMDCWGNSPTCADCLWARKIIVCP